MSGEIENAVSRVANKVGVDRGILERLVYNESRGNPAVGMDVTNYSAGIAQISRNVWHSYSNAPYSEASNPRDYEYNMEVGAQYLKANYHRFHSWKLALAAYNEGPTIVREVLDHKRDFSPITKQYIAGIN